MGWTDFIRKQNYACPDCRFVTRRRFGWWTEPVPVCCETPMERVEHPPKRSDDKAWAEIARKRHERWILESFYGFKRNY